jgi:hypothetical protein
MARKTQSPQHSVRDELTTQFIEALHKDFAEHGPAIIEEIRKSAPAKYGELVLRLIPLPAPQPKAQSTEPKDSREIADRLLADIGLTDADDRARQRALAAYDALIVALESIRDEAIGLH